MKKLTSLPWWIYVLSIDFFFVLASVINPHIFNFPGKQRIFTPINLALEMNLAVWWSTTLLILSGLLAYELFSRRNDHTKLAWLVLGIIFLSLSLDEIGSIHERVRNILPYILLGGILFIYSFTLLYISKDTRRSALFVLAGFTLFGVTAFLEILEHSMYWPEWTIGLRIGLEEGVELAGSFLCLLAVSYQRHGNTKNSLTLTLPVPLRMKSFSELLFVLLLVHSVISLVTARYLEIAHRGNPVVWYPALLFLILFLEFYHQTDQLKIGRISPGRLLSIFFLISSISTVYFISPRVNESKFYLLGLFSNFYLVSFLHLLIANGLFFLMHKTISKTQLLIAVVLGLLLIFGYVSGELSVQYVVAGNYAYLIARLFLGELAMPESKRLHVEDV